MNLTLFACLLIFVIVGVVTGLPISSVTLAVSTDLRLWERVFAGLICGMWIFSVVYCVFFVKQGLFE